MIERLIALAKDEPAVREAAAASLTRMKGEHVTAALAKEFDGGDSERKFVADVLRRRGWSPCPYTRLSFAYHTEDWATVAAAGPLGLNMMAYHDGARAYLIQHISEQIGDGPDVPARLRSLFALPAIQPQVFLAALPGINPPSRRSAVCSIAVVIGWPKEDVEFRLAMLDHISSIEAICDLLLPGTLPFEVVAAAVQAAGRLQLPTAIDPLVRLLTSPSRASNIAKIKEAVLDVLSSLKWVPVTATERAYVAAYRDDWPTLVAIGADAAQAIIERICCEGIPDEVGVVRAIEVAVRQDHAPFNDVDLPHFALEVVRVLDRFETPLAKALVEQFTIHGAPSWMSEALWYSKHVSRQKRIRDLGPEIVAAEDALKTGPRMEDLLALTVGVQFWRDDTRGADCHMHIERLLSQPDLSAVTVDALEAILSLDDEHPATVIRKELLSGIHAPDEDIFTSHVTVNLSCVEIKRIAHDLLATRASA